MRRRIYNLANGKFDEEKPELVFSEERLEIQVVEGQPYRGSFQIKSANGASMRGIVYSSNVRMECLNPQFEGQDVQIRFEFQSAELIEGGIQKGEFTVICNQNEYNLPFVVHITRLYADSSMGRIRTLHDFAMLAAQEREEAYKIFISPLFKNLLRGGNVKERLLYEGLSKPPVTMQNLEEFLIGIRQKAKIELSLETEEENFGNIEERRKESLRIRKNQWGYMELRLKSDTEFLVLQKERMTTDDFVGNLAVVDYYIDEKKLHSGKNYGVITIESPYQTLEYTVRIQQNPQSEPGERDSQEVRRMKARFTEIYVDFRLKKITVGAWATESLEILNHFTALFPEEDWYALMKAQVYLINRQKQEAVWILDEKKRSIQDKESSQWAYYLYLMTLIIREDKYADRVLKTIEEICHKHPEDDRLAWILLFLREDYFLNSSRKYQALKDMIQKGINSPYLYVEACLLIRQEPYLLTELGSFEISLLTWMKRRNVLSAEVAVQVMGHAGSLTVFQRNVYEILCGCYQVYPKKEMLAVICSYLMKGQQFATEYHGWYERGIEEDLRIAGLYEAFINSMNRWEVREVPKIVQMYFRYHSALSYTQKAVLYVNIIANKKNQPSVYESYERIMETFAIEQILERHIDDNLAVIYDTFLQPAMINTKVAEALGDVVYTHKLTCFDENVVRIYVVHPQLKHGQAVGLVNGCAYFSIYGSEYMIFLEDRWGNRYASSMDYQLEKLMKPGKYMEKCMEEAPHALPFLVHYFDKKISHASFKETDLEFLQNFMESEEVSEAYRTRLCPEVIRFYQDRQIPFELSDYLTRMNPSLLNQSARNDMIELLIEKGNFELAYRWMIRFGVEQTDRSRLVTVASYMIEKQSGEEEDFLIYLATEAFLSGKYNDRILEYLCNYYEGPTKVLGAIWKAASEFGLDTFDLEERLLAQMLYTTEYVEGIEDVFWHFSQSGGRDVIQEAFLNYFCQMYFVEHALISEKLMEMVAFWYQQGAEVITVCKLAFLKYLSVNRTEQQHYAEILETWLKEFTEKKIWFPFYKKFDRALLQKYHLYDKIFVEYRGEKNQEVKIHYCVDGSGEYQTERMPEIYHGIYVKAFVLFFGENLEYYISQEDGEKQVITESNRISGNDVVEENEESRYDMINSMLLNITVKEKEKAEYYMQQYEKKDCISKKAFRIL